MPEFIISSRATVVAESETDAEKTVLEFLESMPGVVVVLISGTVTGDATAQDNGTVADEGRSRTYGDVAGPSVPPVSRERRERLLAWLRDDMAPMTVAEVIDCAHEIYGPRDESVARKDLNQLARYALARSFGHPQKWSAA